MVGVGFFDVRGLDERGTFLKSLTGQATNCANVDVAGKSITKGTVTASDGPSATEEGGSGIKKSSAADPTNEAEPSAQETDEASGSTGDKHIEQSNTVYKDTADTCELNWPA